MARDWRWAPAQFDGAKFYVDAHELPGGRRLVIHEYPGSERHDVEDMGRRAGIIEVTAYFVSETADTDSAALRARLNIPGPGTLILPMVGAVRVRAQQWRPSWSKTALNFVGFVVTFVEEGSAFAPTPIGLGASMLAASSAGLANTFASLTSNMLMGSAPSDYIRADIAEALDEGAATTERLRNAVVLPARESSETKAAIADLRVELSKPTEADLPSAMAALVGVIDTIGAEHLDAANVSLFMDTVDTARADAVSAYTRWDVSKSSAHVRLLIETAFAAQAIRVLATTVYTNRRDAANARARIAELSLMLADDYMTLEFEAVQAFERMIGLAASHLSAQIVNLAPVIIVRTGASLPSNVLAYRLYNDVSRSTELVERNRVSTPAMMPTTFEANAR